MSGYLQIVRLITAPICHDFVETNENETGRGIVAQSKAATWSVLFYTFRSREPSPYVQEVSRWRRAITEEVQKLGVRSLFDDGYCMWVWKVTALSSFRLARPNPQWSMSQPLVTNNCGTDS